MSLILILPDGKTFADWYSKSQSQSALEDLKEAVRTGPARGMDWA
jgi:hypothetical protein